MIKIGIDEMTIICRPIIYPETIDDWHRKAIRIKESITDSLKLERLFGNEHRAEKSIAMYPEAREYGYHNFFFRISYDPLGPAKGVAIKFSAAALSAYIMKYKELYGEEINVPDIFNKFSEHTHFDFHCSRIDIFIDYIDENIISITDLYKGLENKEITVVHASGRRNTSVLTGYKQESEVSTLYLGKSRQRNSRLCLRIYDKKQEQLTNHTATHLDTARNCDCWTRVEMQVSEEYARTLTEELRKATAETLPGVLISAILQKYRFIDVDGDFIDITEKMTEITDGSNFTFRPRQEINADLKKRYENVCKRSGLFPLMYQVNEIWGKKGLDVLMDEFNVAWSKYHPNRKVTTWLKKNKHDLKDKRPPFGGEKIEEV